MHTAKKKKFLSILLALALIFVTGIGASALADEPVSPINEPDDDSIAAFALAAPPDPTSFYEAVEAVTTINPITLERTWTDADAYAAKQTVVEQPFQGYYYHNFPDTDVVVTAEKPAALAELADREFQVYIPKHAPQRTFVNVIAVPDGVQANQFLYDQGWFDIANEYGEILVILLPNIQSAAVSTARTWGSPADEQMYLNAVLGMNTRVDANGDQAHAAGEYTHGIFGTRQPNVYLAEQSGGGTTTPVSFAAIGNIYIPLYFVAYGEACAPVEAHTSYVPENVVAQAFINGASAGSAVLNQSAARIHAGLNDGNYYIGYPDDVFRKQLRSIAESDSPYMGGHKVTTDFITNKDIPVPTLLAGSSAAEPSLSYWKSVNHTVATADSNGVYRERIDNGAWATSYTNENLKKWNPGAQYGISKVRATSNASPSAAEIREFMYEFQRMNNFTAYADNLSYRMPYQELNVTARDAYDAYITSGDTLAVKPFTRADGSTGQVELRVHEPKDITMPIAGKNGDGTFHLVMFAYEDRDVASESDGTLDGRDVYIYVPDSAKDKDAAPVIYGMPGTQNGSIQYFAQTQWWTTANEEGFIVVIHGQDYQNRPGSNAANNNNPQGITDSGNTNNSSANYWRSLKELIKSGALDIGAEVDWGRVYASGYSLGANTITTMLMFGSYPQHKEFAALFDQSAGTFTPGASGPVTGELIPVILDAGTPDIAALHMEPWANNVADTGTGSSIMVAPASPALYTNVLAITALNGIGFSFNATGDLEASRQSYIDNLEAIGGSFYQSGRFVNSAFKNWQTFELFRFTRVLGREHNPVPEEMRRGWEYLSRFSIDPVTGDRYYSPSAFTVAGDKTKILAAQPATMTVTFDANGGSSATQTVAVNAPATTVSALPSAPLRGGYRFMGWNRVASGAGEAFDANTVVPGDITVYAQWRSVTPNGGSSSGAVVPPATTPTPTPGSSVSKADLTYISGANRVATSVAIAKSGWTSAGTVVLAQSLIDSLAATPLAFQNNAPILLTTGTLDPAVLAEIQELGATKVIITGAVNPEVIAALKAALPNLQIEQSTGANRFETVALLNQQISDPKGVFIIGYDAIPDAVSVASWAAANGFLIEVAQSDGSYTPSAKAQGLTGYIIGGPALVRDISGFPRIYGADRYATNLKVRQTLSFDYSIIYTANGGTLVDALTGSVLAAKTKSTIVLLPDGDPTGVDFGAITDDTKIYGFGG